MSDRSMMGGVEGWYESDTGFICIVYPRGVVDEEMATAAAKLTKTLGAELFRRGEPLFILADNRNTTGGTPKARKMIASEAKTDTGQIYVAVLYASFAARTLGNVLMRALSLVQGGIVGRVEAEEAPARAWLTEQRRAYLARKTAL
ncbi:MAG TPA: hypothetical protein VM580_09950 [Labilithrix sp.]|nr:hypothetical protein [Labilithrix sp.]